MPHQLVLHCQPEIMNHKELLNKYDLLFSDITDLGEVDVYVNNIEDLNDEQLCSHYGINHDLVNCIEAA